VNRAWAAKLLRSALVVPLILTLGLPGTFSIVVCRFGAMVAPHGCCAGRAREQRATETQDRVAGDSCCSMRALDLGTSLAEHGNSVEGPSVPILAAAWTTSVESRPPRPATVYRPAARALGPPLRLLKQSFLI
jgi:hypothetical protein